MSLTSALEPLAATDGVGIDIRQDADTAMVFHELRDLRNTIRSQERKALSLDDVYSLSGEWKKVRSEALSILQTHSKDLEVAAWLIEASVRVDGFAGLADAFEFLQQLLEQYWPNLYPRPDEEGIAATLFPLTGLNGASGEGTLIMPIRMAALVDLPSGEIISGWEYAKACELAQIADQAKRNKKIDGGVQTLDALRQSATEVNYQSHKESLLNIQRCVDSFLSIEEFLTEQCGHDAPPSSQIKNALEQSLQAIKDVAQISELPSGDADASDDEDSASDGEAATGAEAKPKANTIDNVHTYYPGSREEALILITRLTQFFRDTEPHSPLSYQMERVERWGRMGLVELMDELLDDVTLRSQYYRLIGVTKENG
ncbi:MAG: type VI secretion system protein TssA [Chromatiales bacterium]|nr:type VI secretion system protein TssA [Chromatiales bacterium]